MNYNGRRIGMALNENQMGQILWHLENRVGESGCKMCGGSELKVHPDLSLETMLDLMRY